MCVFPGVESPSEEMIDPTYLNDVTGTTIETNLKQTGQYNILVKQLIIIKNFFITSNVFRKLSG